MIQSAAKEQKKKESAQKKVENSLKKVQVKDGHIFFSSLNIFKAIEVFDDSSFAASTANRDPGVPYIVQSKAISGAIESNLQSMMSVFSAQFGMTPQARASGRVQCPVKASEGSVSKIQEAFMAVKAGEHVRLFTEDEKKNFGLSSDVCLFGFVSGMTYSGPEYLSMANFRYSHRGERLVCLLSFNAFWDRLSAEHKGIKLSDRYNITQFIQDVLQKNDLLIKNLVESAAAGEDGKHVWKATVTAKSVLYVPAGFLVVEQCLNNAINVGVRMSVKDLSNTSKENLTSLFSLHKGTAGTGGVDSKVCKMFKQAISGGD